jgi:hypothetical protein
MALAFKALRDLQPDYPLWRDFAYEYEHDRLAIDLINGSPLLRAWVDDAEAAPGDLEALAACRRSGLAECLPGPAALFLNSFGATLAQTVGARRH